MANLKISKKFAGGKLRNRKEDRACKPHTLEETLICDPENKHILPKV